MSFYTSPSFFAALLVCIIPAAILGIVGKRIRLYGFVASWVFLLLLFSDSLQQLASFFLFMVVSGVAVFATLREFKEGKGRLWVFRLALAAVLVPLVVCKVANVFHCNLLGFVGISYVTFKSVQVLIEVRDGVIKDLGPVDFLYFIVFFPVFTSGPIDRSRRFMEDACKVYGRNEYVDLLTRGLLLLLVGAVYQFVLATLAQQLCNPQPFVQGLSLVENLANGALSGWAYGLFLFFNFAGYSLMAMGASYCLGIRTPRNFKAPFAAVDMKDFWNRWHITLSFWLRDFVFMRFVRSAAKRKWFKSRITTAVCGYMVNMALMGAWHGLSVDYLMYGLYHGALLGLTEVFQKKSSLYKRYKNEIWFKALSWFVTMNLVMLGFALFSGQITMIVGGLIHG